ncbi:ClpXP protease specificity-enhancing factor SspB [Sphingopyxis sp. L1A2A]|uniref:SspB family protein n=1 Tax=Sphingopyxis sp. L1A2A TaxID=2502247 RepID=UPI0010F6E51C|nr:ClpXP protease specificity-enhancing factor SspB [Sphingopyxis sp. L1A2A]
MSDEVRDSLIPYDEIVQDALRAVVGRVLRQVEGYDSLPGEHHFYITFKTQAAGVNIPAHLIAKFPDEMTIVLQNRFWDLKVAADHFSVGLSFNQTPSILTIPYAAITAFVDPSVDFGLQFQVSDDDAAQPEPHDEADNDRPETISDDGSNVVTVDFGKRK